METNIFQFKGFTEAGNEKKNLWSLKRDNWNISAILKTHSYFFFKLKYFRHIETHKTHFMKTIFEGETERRWARGKNSVVVWVGALGEPLCEKCFSYFF